MQSVLIVGNVTKNVFLRLDERSNKFETDQYGTKWLDFSFDGSTHSFFNRVSVYSGASISLEVLNRFGVSASIAGTPATFLDGQFIANDVHTDYRYILCQDDNISLLKSTEANHTKWEAPADAPDWLYIDASAILSPELAVSVSKYLDQNRSVKLALYIRSHTNQHIDYIRELIERADFVIGNARLIHDHPNAAFINDDYIEYHGYRVNWPSDIERSFTTRLTSRLIIAASVLGALLLDKKPDEALLLARANVKKSTLNSTANISTLERDIEDEYYRVKTINKGEQK